MKNLNTRSLKGYEKAESTDQLKEGDTYYIKNPYGNNIIMSLPYTPSLHKNKRSIYIGDIQKQMDRGMIYIKTK